MAMSDKRKAEFSKLMSALTFGLEVEQVGLGRYDRETSLCLNEINSQFVGQERWKYVGDSSIEGHGCEFVSGIMNYSSMEQVQESVRMIRRNGGRSHASCGIHVHVDGSRFFRNPKALVRLIKIVDRYEVHMYHALQADSLTPGQDRSVEWRSPGRKGWSRPLSQDFIDRIEGLGKEPTIDQIKTEWYRNDGLGSNVRYDESRYRLLNLHALWTKGTIEFRCFNSTVHAGKIKAYIQLCMLICTQALLSSRATRGQRDFNEETAHYQVRTWLIRFGGNGDEFKTMRHHLCSHLKGDASFHCKKRPSRAKDAEQVSEQG